MRVKCQIKIINNSGAARGFGQAGGKSAQATLFVAKMSNDVVHLVYCTTKNKQGIKHKVKDNVECIFARFIQEGKATIQLKEPPVNISISNAQPSELKSLLFAVKLANKGDSLTNRGILSSMAPARAKHVQRPKSKMVISSKQDYSVCNGFPSTLERLTVTNCDLPQIDLRIFSLKALVELNLGSNCIKNISDSISNLPNLAMLNLSSNVIDHIPESVFLEHSNLTTLDLSHNKLEFLPNSICKLKKLWHLNVSHNCIKCLPRHIGQLSNLRKLFLAHNHLLFLPSSILFLRLLESLDVFENHFLNFCNLVVNRTEINFSTIPSLLELAGAIVRKTKMHYNNVNYVPYPLIHFLDSALQCCCGKYCFDKNIHYVTCSKVETLSSVFGSVSGFDCVSVQVGVCSKKCLGNMKKRLNT